MTRSARDVTEAFQWQAGEKAKLEEKLVMTSASKKGLEKEVGPHS